MPQRHCLATRITAHLLLSMAIWGGGLSLITLAQYVPNLPSGQGLPGRRQGGGTRGGCIRSSETSLIALVPDNSYGTTLEPYPTFFWYIPQTVSSDAEFVLLDENDNEVYRTDFAVSNNPGVASLTLPQDAGVPPLEVGKKYHWYFSLICDQRDRSGDIFAEGWIQRVDAPVGLVDRLTATPAGDRPNLYAQSGIWHDALTSLAKLRRAEPGDPALLNRWTVLLQSVGLEGIASQPLINCCTATPQ